MHFAFLPIKNVVLINKLKIFCFFNRDVSSNSYTIICCLRGKDDMRTLVLRQIRIFITFIFVLVGSTTWFMGTVNAREEEYDNESQLILLENNEQISEVENYVRELDPKAEIKEIKDINLLKIKASSYQKKELIEMTLSHELGLTSENIGEEQKVYLNDGVLDSISFSQSRVGTNLDYLRQAQWDVLEVTNQGQSYNLQTGNHDISIGLIDSGVDFEHPDLAQNILSPGKSFVPGIFNTQDVLGHGTMVAGSVASNGVLQGVGPNIGIIPYKVFHDGGAESYWIIEAIVQAVNDRVDVINLSLGTYKAPKNKDDKVIIKAYEKAIKFARKQGVFVVASAGSDGYNIDKPFKIDEDGQEVIHLPGGMKDVFTVASTTKERTLSSLSNYGKKADMGAPGGDFGVDFKENQIFDINSMILTIVPTHLKQSPIATYFGLPIGYDYSGGSSLAAPKVAATAALIIAEYEELNGEKPSINKIEEYLIKGATNRENKVQKEQFRFGILNTYNSLELVR